MIRNRHARAIRLTYRFAVLRMVVWHFNFIRREQIMCIREIIVDRLQAMVRNIGNFAASLRFFCHASESFGYGKRDES